jgi:hypothetical protein
MKNLVYIIIITLFSCSSKTDESINEAPKSYEEGVTAFKSGNLTEAEKAFKDQLNKSDASLVIKAETGLMFIYFKKNLDGLNKEYLNKILAKQSKNPDANYVNAFNLFNEKDYALSESKSLTFLTDNAAYKFELDSASNRSDIAINLIEVQFFQKKYTECLSSIKTYFDPTFTAVGFLEEALLKKIELLISLND